jgi:hypothetical protein
VAASLTRLHGSTTSVEELVAVLDVDGVAMPPVEIRP